MSWSEADLRTWVPERVAPALITPETHSSLGANINGPSVIKVPSWVDNPMGEYYMYFASHSGSSIRMAFADDVEGPWHVYPPGVLHVDDTGFIDHIASPDVHVDEGLQQIRMYFHGLIRYRGWEQGTRLATSVDGIVFQVNREVLGAPYFRAFRWSGMWYVLGMPGIFYRSADGISGFEVGPRLFTDSMRHSAVCVDGDILSIFYTNVGACPEAILSCQIRLEEDWYEWSTTEPKVLLEPELAYEGGTLKLSPSERGAAHEPVRQLRDPCIFREGETMWLFYAIAGERGIAVARLSRGIDES